MSKWDKRLIFLARRTKFLSRKQTKTTGRRCNNQYVSTWAERSDQQQYRRIEFVQVVCLYSQSAGFDVHTATFGSNRLFRFDSRSSSQTKNLRARLLAPHKRKKRSYLIYILSIGKQIKRFPNVLFLLLRFMGSESLIHIWTVRGRLSGEGELSGSSGENNSKADQLSLTWRKWILYRDVLMAHSPMNVRTEPVWGAFEKISKTVTTETAMMAARARAAANLLRILDWDINIAMVS